MLKHPRGVEPAFPHADKLRAECDACSSDCELMDYDLQRERQTMQCWGALQCLCEVELLHGGHARGVMRSDWGHVCCTRLCLYEGR